MMPKKKGKRFVAEKGKEMETYGMKTVTFHPTEADGLNSVTFIPTDVGGMNSVTFIPTPAGGFSRRA